MITYKTLIFSAIFTVILADSNPKLTEGVEDRDKSKYIVLNIYYMRVIVIRWDSITEVYKILNPVHKYFVH